MLPAYLNIRDIDKRLRELVVRLNRLPYAVTISSCEGHVLSGIDYPGTESWFPWQLANRGGHPKIGLTIQTDVSYESKEFIRELSEFCDRYSFVHLMPIEADTEEQMTERLKGENFRIYGFKFPLGKEAYAIDIEAVKGEKESVIASKRKVNKFWTELTLEVSKYET